MKKGQTDVIVMDFSKAFDKVDHNRLLLKLHRFGINNDVTTLIVVVVFFSLKQNTASSARWRGV